MFRVLVLPSAAALGMLISGSYFLVAHKQKSLCYLSHRRACLSFNFCCWSLIYRGILNLIFLGAWYLNLCKLVWSYLEPWRRRQAHSSVIRSLGNFWAVPISRTLKLVHLMNRRCLIVASAGSYALDLFDADKADCPVFQGTFWALRCWVIDHHDLKF